MPEDKNAVCWNWILSNREVMVVGEGFEPSKSMTADLQSAPFGRSGTPPGVMLILRYNLEMVVGEGFEPSKSMTADLQSAPFGRSGTPPRGNTFTGLLPAGSGAHHIK